MLFLYAALLCSEAGGGLCLDTTETLWKPGSEAGTRPRAEGKGPGMLTWVLKLLNSLFWSLLHWIQVTGQAYLVEGRASLSAVALSCCL